jgi:hypothetical protein
MILYCFLFYNFAGVLNIINNEEVIIKYAADDSIYTGLRR